MKKIVRSHPAIVSLAFAFLFTACGHDDENDHDHDHDALAEVIEHACGHAQNGPFADVTASADRADATQAVSAGHTTYRITLPSGDAGFQGSVVYTPSTSGDIVFLLSQDVSLSIFHEAHEVEVELSESVESCPGGIIKAVVAELEVGTEYTLELGPTAHEVVNLMTESVGGHDHHQH